MADGAIVLSDAQEKVKKAPLVSIPSTFLLPYVKVDDIVLPAGGTFFCRGEHRNGNNVWNAFFVNNCLIFFD